MCTVLIDRMVETVRCCKSRTEEEEVIAIENYKPLGSSSALSIKKDDRFLLRSEGPGNWKVKSRSSGRVGFAPSRILAKIADIQHFEWISFDATRITEEALLMNPKFAAGAFIIRPQSAEGITNSLSLSVKLKNTVDSKTCNVVRFQINRTGGSFRLQGGQNVFKTLAELVQHHAGRFNGSNLKLSFSVKKNQSVTPWEYQPHSIARGERLASGHFSEIYKGVLCGKEDVAIKVARIDPVEFFREAEISRFCKHPNVLETIGICRVSSSIITEYMSSGDLKKYVQCNQISSDNCLSVVEKVSNAMEYLSRENIVHRDLAARNILVGESLDNIKVANFGLARKLNDSSYYTTTKETFPIKWTAPESFVIFDGITVTKEGNFSSASDVWSFAVLLWELYANGQDPYSPFPSSELYNMLTEENYRLPKPGKCSRKIYTYMLECWNINRESRPTFAEIHQYFTLLLSEAEHGESLSQSDTDDDYDSD